jgi:hypothetical protein
MRDATTKGRALMRDATRRNKRPISENCQILNTNPIEKRVKIVQKM